MLIRAKITQEKAKEWIPEPHMAIVFTTDNYKDGHPYKMHIPLRKFGFSPTHRQVEYYFKKIFGKIIIDTGDPEIEFSGYTIDDIVEELYKLNRFPEAALFEKVGS